MEFNHVALSVNNLDESTAFYQKHFGFVLDGTYQKPDGPRFCFLRKDAFRIELFEFTDSKPPDDDQLNIKIIGLRHLAFKVGNLEETVETLKKSGLNFGAIVNGTSCKYYTFTTDPNGIAIELYESNKKI